MNCSFKKVASAVALAVLAAPSVSVAQGLVLDEIVVTANKRTSTLQSIPVSLSVTTDETIEAAQIQDILDLQSVVPTLRVSQNQSTVATSYLIRGFGNGGNDPGVEPSVGVFIDGVYRSRAGSSISDFPNLERIEVISGPQSTLFGKNASAGVISVVTKKPSGERAGKVSANFGNYNAVLFKGYYEDALSETASFSLAASSNTRDGYNTNLTTGGDLNNRDRQAIRGQLLLKPNDTTEIRVIADYDTIDEECCAAVNILATPTSTAAIEFAGGQIIANDPGSFDSFGNIDPTNQIDNSGLSIQIDKEFSSFGLTSITSYREIDAFSIFDADFSSADIILGAGTNDFETFTQELRLTSKGDKNIDWTVGAFYFDEYSENEADTPFGADFRSFINIQSLLPGVPPQFANQANFINVIEGFLGVPVGATFYQEGQGVTHESTLDNQAISIFGQADFHLSDRLTATVGLNYTRDEKEATLTPTRLNEFSNIDLPALASAVFTGATGLPLSPGNLAAVGLSGPEGAQLAGSVSALLSPEIAGLQFLPPFPALPNSVEDNTSDDDELTYSLRLAYDLTDSINVYGGYSTGFKASSWNLSRDSRPTIDQVDAVRAALGTPNLIAGTRFASPEEAKVFEVGLKARFSRGAFNIALFDQSIEGFQSNVFTGAGFNLTNAGEQSVKGAEFDITYFPIDNLELKLAGTFLDPLYDEFRSAGRNSLTGETYDLSGRTPGGITEVNLSLSANYSFELKGNAAFLRADYFYEEDTPVGDFIPENPNLNIGQFSRDSKNLNISAGITTPNRLSFALWLRNATDHESFTFAFPGVAQPGTFSGYRVQPRTYGISIAKEF